MPDRLSSPLSWTTISAKRSPRPGTSEHVCCVSRNDADSPDEELTHSEPPISTWPTRRRHERATLKEAGLSKYTRQGRYPHAVDAKVGAVDNERGAFPRA